MKKYLIIALLLLNSYFTYSQGEASNWIFGWDKSGITFASGEPQDLSYPIPLTNSPSTVVSDSAGNLLFYSDGFQVYNKNFQVMDNGNEILGGRFNQSCIAFAKPGSLRFYYLFTVGEPPDTPPPSNQGGRYSIIDMQANGGLGKVTVKNIMLDQGEDAMIKITATFHKNNKQIWLITENQDLNHYYYKSYLVSGSGIFLKKTLIQNKNIPGYFGTNGSSQMRVSPDGKKITNVGDQFENVIGYMYSFNNETGLINFLFGIKPIGFQPWGAEFSPSSEFVYICGPTQKNMVVQFNAQSEDSIVFNSSKVIVGSFSRYYGNGAFGMMQCAPDGKIYGARSINDTLFAINKPDLLGPDCNATACAYKTNGKMGVGLPQFLTSYAQRFFFSGTCANEPFQFTSNFFPEPTSILWDFGDGGTSTDLNPLHAFTIGGNYSVTATVVFPNGSTGEATREVYVAGLPNSELPEEITICKDEEATLNAGLFNSYSWSNGDTVQSILVSDTGYYWVEIQNDTGCIARDTVLVNWFELPEPDTTYLVISPSTCSGATGAIKGLQLIGGTPPITIKWLDNSGATISTVISPLANLPSDNYYLWVTDGNGCTYLLKEFFVQNIDQDLIIKNVIANDAYCDQLNGKIEIEVESGLNDLLLYSVDNGTSWHDNLGHFEGLPASGNYVVKAKDTQGCVAVYKNNPVKIENLAGVIVTQPSVTPELDTNANGEIIIHAKGDTLQYQIGLSLPQSDSVFSNLTKNIYTITVTDIHGCDTTFQVEVLRITGQTLHAIAGDTLVCIGFRAREPLMVSNFQNIASFEITLAYNSSLLEAGGYDHIAPQLEDGLDPVVYPSSGTIKLKWSGAAPVSLPDGTVLLDLVMQTDTPGLSTVDWVMAGGSTWFLNPLGDTIPVIPQTGTVQVMPPPAIMPFFEPKVCENSPIMQMIMVSGGTGTSSVKWETPTGINYTTDMVYIDSAKMEHSGLYSVQVVDELNCMATDSVQVTVIPLPKADFPTLDGTITFEQSYLLQAQTGYVSYEWNTGDTTYFINVTEEGEYYVVMQTEEGCMDTNFVMMKSTWFPFEVPNAFTPNGDGLNDVFMAVVDADRVKQYSMCIYNRWGQLIFETHDAMEGWDGMNGPAGVYSWVISYADSAGKAYKLRGSVAVIK